jgi:hypothetical protein
LPKCRKSLTGFAKNLEGFLGYFWVSSIIMFNNFYSKRGEVLDGDRDGKCADGDVKLS